MGRLEENYGRFDVPTVAPKTESAVFSPATEAHLAACAARREKEIVEIKRLWTNLCRLRGTKNSISALNGKINDWFEVADGLDALDGGSIEKVQTSLRKSIEKEEKK